MTKFSITRSLIMSLLISAGSLLAAPTGGSTCENLSRLSLPHVTITSAAERCRGRVYAASRTRAGQGKHCSL